MALVAALALLANLSFAQELNGGNFRDYSGGQVDTVDASNLQSNQSPSLLNVVIDDPAGSLKPRNGFLQCGGRLPSGNTATALYQYSKTDGTRRLIVSDNTNVWQTADCITFSTIAASIGSLEPYFTTVRNKLWVVNGSTFPYTWDGTTAVILDGRTNTPSPTPPKCKYIEFWRERVWCSRTSGEPSSIQFSALTDSSGGSLDPSTGTLSWPAANTLYVDQDGGSPIYGIKSFRDRLYVFKDNGIWQIIFRSEFDLSIVKTLSSIGTRFQNSIREVDNFLYFVGPDGLYKFDGEQSVRVSALAENQFREINQPLVNNQFKIWTTASDFAAGTLTNASTVYYNGSVVPEMTTFDNFNDGDFTASPAWSVDSGTSSWTVGGGSISFASTANGNISSTATMPSGVWATRMRMARASNDMVEYQFMSNAARTADNTGGYSIGYCENVAGLCSGTNGTFLFKISGGGHSVIGQEVGATDTGIHDFRVHRTPGGAFTVFIDNTEIITAADTDYTTSAGFGLFATGGSAPSPQHSFDDIRIGLSSYTLFTSDIYDAVSVSSWSVFDADYTENGGAISFQVRVGSNTGAVNTRAWNDINPGSIISGATDQTLVQWRAVIYTSTNSALFPQINSVTVNYTQGGATTQQLHGGAWKNRYWLTASTGTSTSNNFVWIKSREPSLALVPNDLQIGAMTVYNDLFYAVASTHSAIYRMDYGTNDNGKAINWFWESRDETYGQPNVRKYLMEITADYRKGTESSLRIGYSRDQGQTYTEKTVNASGTGRGTSRLFTSGSSSLDYRFRAAGSTLDGTVTVIGLTGWARPAKLRE